MTISPVGAFVIAAVRFAPNLRLPTQLGGAAALLRMRRFG